MTDVSPPGDPAPIDLAAVLADIDREVAAKRSSGELPEGFERDLDVTFGRFAPVDTVTGDFDTLVTKLETSTGIDVRASTVSSRPGVAQVKTLVAKAIGWELRHLADQTSGLAHATTRALRMLGDRVDELERQATGTTESVVLDLAAPERPLLPDGDWGELLGAALAGTTGRVCHAECGDGTLVAALRAAGLDVYGVDPDEHLVIGAQTSTPDLRAGSVTGHLDQLGDGALGALVLSGVTDRSSPSALLELLSAARRVVAVGGWVAVIGHQPTTWDRRTVLADLAAGRPLHAETWERAFAHQGLTAVSAHPGADGFVVLGRR